jgi:hypothetical protein
MAISGKRAKAHNPAAHAQENGSRPEVSACFAVPRGKQQK